jgi:cytochrome c oxidase subunit 2
MVVLKMRDVVLRWSSLLCVLAMAGSSTGAVQPPPRRVIHISAERFIFTPSEITVDAGEEVELRLTSDDTAHGFRIKGTDINLVLPKRGKGEVSAVLGAMEPGRYAFECTRMCGAGHNFMKGMLVVRPRTAPTTE